MKLLQALKELFSLLESFHGSWAVCGGIAATVYRETPRFTGDIDIAIVGREPLSAIHIAEAVLRRLNYSPMAGFIADREGNLGNQQALVIGRETTSETFLGVDFLLPVIPWVSNAVVRAQSNILDYGFVSAPTITVEDLIIAKLYALKDSPERISDQDDIDAILRGNNRFDLNYLQQQAAFHRLTLPATLVS